MESKSTGPFAVWRAGYLTLNPIVGISLLPEARARYARTHNQLVSGKRGQPSAASFYQGADLVLSLRWLPVDIGSTGTAVKK
jgi:hypothetical protein